MQGILEHASSDFRERSWPSLGEDVKSRLSRYCNDLLYFNRALNLVSRHRPEHRIAALLEECLSAGTILSRRGLAGSAWADLGSGGGIPGLILAARDPGQQIVLIERRQGRCDFLRREVRTLDLARVRVEEADARALSGSGFDVVLAKAVAPPGEIEKLAGDLLGGFGVLVAFGRPGDRTADGWNELWSEPLPGPRSIMRGLRPVK
jgi:16S rRNA (guanine527-N7)-methyltransferase